MDETQSCTKDTKSSTEPSFQKNGFFYSQRALQVLKRALQGSVKPRSLRVPLATSPVYGWERDRPKLNESRERSGRVFAAEIDADVHRS